MLNDQNILDPGELNIKHRCFAYGFLKILCIRIKNLFARTVLWTARYLLDNFVIFLVVVPILLRRKGVAFQYSGLAL